MNVLPKLIDGLLGSYLRDHSSAEMYPATWIDSELSTLSYEELGVLISEVFPLMEKCDFEFNGKLEGHNAFESVVAMVFEQLFKKYEVLVDPAELEGHYVIHAGRLALFKNADPDKFQRKVA